MKCSIVFEIQTGTSDRGAPLNWVSQYPNEEEVLYAPLTALDVVGQPQIERVDGGDIVIIKLRISCNQADMGAVGRTKQLFLKMTRNVLQELHQNGAPACALATLQTLLSESEDKSDSVFDRSDEFQTATNNLMELKKAVHTTLQEADGWGVAHDPVANYYSRSSNSPPILSSKESSQGAA